MPVVNVNFAGGALTIDLGAVFDTVTVTAIAGAGNDLLVTGTQLTPATFNGVNSVSITGLGTFSSGQSATISSGPGQVFALPGALQISNVEAVSLAPSGTLQAGSVTTSGVNSTVSTVASVTTTGSQTYGADMVLGTRTPTFTASSPAAAVAFNASLNVFPSLGDGTVDLVVNTPGGGTTRFSASASSFPRLRSVTTDAPGTTQLSGGSIGTVVSQTYNDPVQVLGFISLSNSSPAGTVVFNSTVDGSGAGSLSISNAGNTRFTGAVGQGSAPNSLFVGGGTTNFATGLVTTTGSQSYSTSVTLNVSTVMTSSSAFGGVSFNGNLAGVGAPTLTVNTAGTTTFGGQVNGLNSISTDAPGTTRLSTGTIQTVGQQTYNDRVFVDVPTTLTTPTATFNNRLDLGTRLLSVSGSFILSSGATFATLLASPTSFGRVNSGTAGLGGAALNLTLGSGFFPALGTQFVIVDAASPVSGTFAGGPTYTAGAATLTIDYSSGNAVLSVANVVIPNTPPTITPVSNRRVLRDGVIDNITFTVNDAETPAANLTVTATSDNPVLIPEDGLVLSGTGRDRRLRITPEAGRTGTAVITLTVTDARGATATVTFTVVVEEPPPPPPAATRLFALAAGAGGAPRVRVFNADGALRFDFFAIEDLSFRGGVRVAVGDLTGDDVDDVVVTFGPGGGPRVAVIDGATGVRLLPDFFAYEDTFRGGLFVAIGDVNGDGRNDVMFGPSSAADAIGGPRVRVLDGKLLTEQGSAAALAAPVADFFAYDPAFQGGVRVAAGDLDGDGKVEIITAPGPSGAPHVRVFGGDGTLRTQFFAFDDPSFRGGAFVAAGYAGGLGPRIFVTADSFPGFAGTQLEDLFSELPTTTGAVTGGKASTRTLIRPPTLQVYRFDPLAGAATLEPGGPDLATIFQGGGVRVAGFHHATGGGVLLTAGTGGGGRVQLYPVDAGSSLSTTPTLDFSAFGTPQALESIYVGAGQNPTPLPPPPPASPPTPR